MRLYEKADERAADEVRKLANANVCDSEKIGSEDFTYIFDEEKAICTFMLKDRNEFRSLLLKTCYHLSVTQFGITADGKNYAQPFSYEKAEKFVRLFFPENERGLGTRSFHDKGSFSLPAPLLPFRINPLWEKARYPASQDMTELVENKYFLYDTEESNGAEKSVTKGGSYSFGGGILSVSVRLPNSEVKHVQKIQWKGAVTFKNGYKTFYMMIPVNSNDGAKKIRAEFRQK